MTESCMPGQAIVLVLEFEVTSSKTFEDVFTILSPSGNKWVEMRDVGSQGHRGMVDSEE